MVYVHYQMYFDQNDNDRYPREAVGLDLLSETETQQEQEYQLIIMMDTNEECQKILQPFLE